MLLLVSFPGSAGGCQSPSAAGAVGSLSGLLASVLVIPSFGSTTALPIVPWMPGSDLSP